MQKASEDIQRQTVESVRTMAGRVKDLLGELTSHKMIHLYQLHSSPKYVDRLVRTLLTAIILFVLFFSGLFGIIVGNVISQLNATDLGCRLNNSNTSST